jgi:Flp pilus assembly protein TadG
VETALVLPVLLLLLLLAVDFGRLFTTFVAINNAAREGAFYAAEHAKDTPFDETSFNFAARQTAEREVNVQSQGGEGTLLVDSPVCHVAGDTTATMQCDLAANSSSALGMQVTVSVTQPFTLVTPVVGELFGGAVDLSASATAPVLSPATVTILAPAATPTPLPTATPTLAPTPTPDPAATPTPTPDPAATPTPTPSPTPEPTCTVSDLSGQYYDSDPGALDKWILDGFTGALVDNAGGKKIKTQSLQPNAVVLCTTSMTVSDDNHAYPYP